VPGTRRAPTPAEPRSPTAVAAFGITTFDASAGGLGGCPYAPGAAGNLATDDLVYMLNGLGVKTGVSLPALSDASAFIASRLDHPLPSRYAQAALPGAL
jgi:hydroxymethylglutaryl-CoA lyase